MNEPPSYGGFKALTWEHHKKDLNNFHLKHYSAKDIPTSLPDSINGLSEYTRSNRGMQDIFRAFILESVAEDETGAPDIEIVNEVDTEPTPLFEFKYSNRMWYGEGVPPPDYNKLKGCECVGGCDPRSKKCACAVRQREYLGMEDGCVYDKNGRLKHPRYPILECNEMCACDDDCRNRVVQHGRKCQVNLKKTPNKGWGVFNGPRRIPKGTFIGIYAGELLTDEQGEQRGTYYNKIGKTYLFDIDFWHLRIDENSDDWHNKYTVDAFHAGNNHSCDPNARLQACYINEPDIEKPLLVVFSTRDIDPHQEICFSYTGNYPEDGPDEEEEVQKEKREDPVYIECKCGAWNCTGMFLLVEIQVKC
ncbi:SET domain-containing protein [Macrolepiota fuliginosa MF-IS2]|uniref:SET domain-containing protein n=1 Tax=Macrolepiota fuliginosa MF-IS2 TaxID=1400762 RepID=A0A9P5XBW7_9AGAR|nr:SET domain-containing protein [Macrolepiota fuliginosa MF-IS2]